jgi:hypothetical protein
VRPSGGRSRSSRSRRPRAVALRLPRAMPTRVPFRSSSGSSRSSR